jgi:HEPN domain-containing protein
MQLDEDKAAHLVEYWNEGSKEDLESAEAILSSALKVGPALFYLHLSIEKALKAAYVKKYKEHAPYTHNLPVLVEKLGWLLQPHQIADLSEINQFNTIGIYPDQKAKIRLKYTKEYAIQFLTKGKEIIKWIHLNSADL